MKRGREPVFAGNWKMNYGPAETREFLREFLPLCPRKGDGEIIFFPPAVSLPAAREMLRDRPDVHLGVQNVFWQSSGAFTGEISPSLAASAGADFALVGHSERRALFGETVEDTRRKTLAALEAGLGVIFCVGETLEEREAGKAEAVVRAQLEPVLQAVSGRFGERWMIAYEPVWAIGTGRTATSEDAQGMHGFVRSLLARASLGGTAVLYGGSVKPDNVAALLACPDVDGVLVGGASLDPRGFSEICATRA